MNWQHLDTQMRAFSAQLTSEVRLKPDIVAKLATTIAADVRFLTPEQKVEIRAASPVPLADRLAELQAFQGWMDKAHTVRNNPFVTRAQVLSQNYICFVYLPEHVFVFCREHVQAAQQQRNAPNSQATTLCVHFEMQSLTPIGHTDLISEPSSIGLARAMTQPSRSKNLKLGKANFRFGKPSADVSHMQLIPTCKRSGTIPDASIKLTSPA